MRQLNLVAESSSTSKLSGLSLGYVVFSDIKNVKSNAALDAALADAVKELCARFKTTSEISSDPVVKGIRAIFSQAGTDPTKERPSGEALMRRIVDGKGIYRINAAVDVNNIISLQTGCPCGVYDADKLSGDTITLFVGRQDDSYEGISGKPVNGDGRLLTKDATSIFGGPVADSKRTSITLETKNVLMLVYFPSAAPHEKLNDAINTAINLMQRCCGAAAVAHGVFSID